MLLHTVLCAAFYALHFATARAHHSTFVSRHQNDLVLRYVENSGVCETTPGVQQVSGYINIGADISMWFWFFAAREKPENAPFTLWLNGGPICSSMIGLFEENGPCKVLDDNTTTEINPHSWNSASNMIYIDQPMGAGFSYGTDHVNSTNTAAPFVWKAFQILFESKLLSKLKSRDFIFASESYGGHYGPAFVTYFKEQNIKIQQGVIQGDLINVKALMVNNGWFDPLINYGAYVDFANYAPGYGQLQSDEALCKMSKAWFGHGGCQEQAKACYAAGDSSASNKICSDADAYCAKTIAKLAAGDRYIYDLRQNVSGPIFPPTNYVTFLNSTTTKKKIGARLDLDFTTCVDSEGFIRTGDLARNFLPQLAALVDSGLKVLIWAGDADIDCNWVGGHTAMLSMDWYGKDKLQVMPFHNISFGGKTVAAVKNLDNFTFARIYDAGHEVPAFQPEASLEIFRQVIRGEPLHSVNHRVVFEENSLAQLLLG